MKPLAEESRVTVFFDGIFTEPQLNHPEGIAIDAQGHIWCGGERGEIFRIDRDGRSIEQIAATGGFTLGVALDSAGMLYACDLKNAIVHQVNTKTGEHSLFADGDGAGRRLRVPNVPVVDEENGYLYVSDSYNAAEAGPGVWRFELATGKGGLWYKEPLRFANGLALSSAERCLYVAETHGRKISRIPILPNGEAGVKEQVVQLDDDVMPDGLALDEAGRLYISCYEPSQICRWSPESGLELLYRDKDAHTLCHPTNCAIRGRDLFLSNLGRWHITRIADIV